MQAAGDRLTEHTAVTAAEAGDIAEAAGAGVVAEGLKSCSVPLYSRYVHTCPYLIRLNPVSKFV